MSSDSDEGAAPDHAADDNRIKVEVDVVER